MSEWKQQKERLRAERLRKAWEAAIARGDTERADRIRGRMSDTQQTEMEQERVEAQPAAEQPQSPAHADLDALRTELAQLRSELGSLRAAVGKSRGPVFVAKQGASAKQFKEQWPVGTTLQDDTNGRKCTSDTSPEQLIDDADAFAVLQTVNLVSGVPTARFVRIGGASLAVFEDATEIVAKAKKLRFDGTVAAGDGTNEIEFVVTSPTAGEAFVEARVPYTAETVVVSVPTTTKTVVTNVTCAAGIITLTTETVTVLTGAPTTKTVRVLKS